MAVLTLNGHVSRAIDFLNRDNTYIAFARSTPWEDEKLPPVAKATDTIEELLGVKKVTSKFLVVPDDQGTLSYGAVKFRFVPITEGYIQGARWAFIRTELDYNELDVDMVYRQLGVYTGLKRKEGVDSGKYALLPDEIEDPGVLEILDNRRPTYREADKYEKVTIVVEF